MSIAADDEVAILARVLGNDQEELPPDMARYLLGLEFGQRDKDRMHTLAAGNRDEVLSKSEKSELLAYAKAGTVLSILKSKARRILKVKPKQRAHS